MKKLVIAALSIAIGTLGVTTSHAATTIQGEPFTNLNPAGDKVHFGFAAFPKGKGFYFYEAVKPATGQRPTLYSQDQIWVSESDGATSPKGDIAVSVSATFAGADCSKDQCGVFVRLDHNAPTDMSEDQFFPISFKAGSATPMLATDTISLTMDGNQVSGQTPGTLNYRTPKKVIVTTLSGSSFTIVSSTPDCAVNGSQIEALKSTGDCDFKITSAGNDQYASKSSHFPFHLAPGIQAVAFKSSTVKSGKKLALPSITNFGEMLTYKVSGNCFIKGATLTAKKAGSCLVKYNAPAASNYPALAGNISVKINK